MNYQVPPPPGRMTLIGRSVRNFFKTKGFIRNFDGFFLKTKGFLPRCTRFLGVKCPSMTTVQGNGTTEWSRPFLPMKICSMNHYESSFELTFHKELPFICIIANTVKALLSPPPRPWGLFNIGHSRGNLIREDKNDSFSVLLPHISVDSTYNFTNQIQNFYTYSIHRFYTFSIPSTFKTNMQALSG